MKKKTIDNACFFIFFHNTGPNLAQILPQDHAYFGLFVGFQWNMLEHSINPIVLKKKCAKTSKNYYFLVQLPQ